MLKFDQISKNMFIKRSYLRAWAHLSVKNVIIAINIKIQKNTCQLQLGKEP